MNQSLNSCIDTILSYQRESEKTISDMTDRNAAFVKALSSVRSLLERCLKNPALLNSAVYDSIDICRANLVYLDYSSGKNKKDLPLSDGEKTLPEHNGNQNTNR